MVLLEAALDRAVAGEGQVVGVVGEAGVGKSRLCFEFVERCRAKGITVREARGVSHGKSIPFLAIDRAISNNTRNAANPENVNISVPNSSGGSQSVRILASDR